MALLTTVATCANVACGVLGGMLSDRLKRRKLFAAGAAACPGGAMIVFSLVPGWPVVVAGFVIFGCAVGCYYAVDMALVSQVLPSYEGRRQGPGGDQPGQHLAPGHGADPGDVGAGPGPRNYHALYLVAAGLAAAGGLAILPIRGVR